MDLDTVRAAGQRVIERRRFTARTVIEVPQEGARAASTYTVDLERGLVRTSTRFTMGPPAGASTSWTPKTSDPVVHWVIGDRLLMQLPGESGASRWLSAPETPLLDGGLSLLLWPAGVIEPPEPQGASGAISAVVDLNEVIERTPAIHAGAVAQSIEQMSLTADDRVAVQLTLVDGALTQIDVDVDVDVEGEPTRRLVHLWVDPGVPAPLGDPPSPQEELDADELMRRLEASAPGGPKWWTKTRPFRA